MAGMVSDYFGRVKSCIVNTLIFSIGCVAACLAPDMYFLIVCRFIMGIGLGAAYPAGYSALTEYTPPTKRGQYQAWVGLIANCGTPFASFVSLVLLPLFGWRRSPFVARLHPNPEPSSGFRALLFRPPRRAVRNLISVSTPW